MQEKAIVNGTLTEAEWDDRLPHSPYTGMLTCIALHNVREDTGSCFYVSDSALPELPERKPADSAFAYRPCSTEKNMLTRALRYIEKNFLDDQIVTYNGRTWDIPFLMVRCAANDVYFPFSFFNTKRYEDNHMDIKDRLEMFGAGRFYTNLGVTCEAFGVASPKDGDASGASAPLYWGTPDFHKIPRYCAGDARATSQLGLTLEKLGIVTLWK